MVGWGSTYGAIAAAVDELRHAGTQRRAPAPALLESLPRQSGRDPREVQTHSGSGEQHGAPPLDAPRPVPRGCRRAAAKSKAGRSASGKFKSTSKNCWENNTDEQLRLRMLRRRPAGGDASAADARRTFNRPRRSNGVRAAGISESLRKCRTCCRGWAFPAKKSCSSPASDARRVSRTISTPTGFTAFTAARRPSPWA